jgi:hypothetical protein
MTDESGKRHAPVGQWETPLGVLELTRPSTIHEGRTRSEAVQDVPGPPPSSGLRIRSSLLTHVDRSPSFGAKSPTFGVGLPLSPLPSPLVAAQGGAGGAGGPAPRLPRISISSQAGVWRESQSVVSSPLAGSTSPRLAAAGGIKRNSSGAWVSGGSPVGGLRNALPSAEALDTFVGLGPAALPSLSGKERSLRALGGGGFGLQGGWGLSGARPSAYGGIMDLLVAPLDSDEEEEGVDAAGSMPPPSALQGGSSSPALILSRPLPLPASSSSPNLDSMRRMSTGFRRSRTDLAGMAAASGGDGRSCAPSWTGSSLPPSPKLSSLPSPRSSGGLSRSTLPQLDGLGAGAAAQPRARSSAAPSTLFGAAARQGSSRRVVALQDFVFGYGSSDNEDAGTKDGERGREDQRVERNRECARVRRLRRQERVDILETSIAGLESSIARVATHKWGAWGEEAGGGQGAGARALGGREGRATRGSPALAPFPLSAHATGGALSGAPAAMRDAGLADLTDEAAVRAITAPSPLTATAIAGRASGTLAVLNTMLQALTGDAEEIDLLATVAATALQNPAYLVPTGQARDWTGLPRAPTERDAAKQRARESESRLAVRLVGQVEPGAASSLQPADPHDPATVQAELLSLLRLSPAQAAALASIQVDAERVAMRLEASSQFMRAMSVGGATDGAARAPFSPLLHEPVRATAANSPPASMLLYFPVADALAAPLVEEAGLDNFSIFVEWCDRNEAVVAGLELPAFVTGEAAPSPSPTRPMPASPSLSSLSGRMADVQLASPALHSKGSSSDLVRLAAANAAAAASPGGIGRVPSFGAMPKARSVHHSLSGASPSLNALGGDTLSSEGSPTWPRPAAAASWPLFAAAAAAPEAAAPPRRPLPASASNKSMDAGSDGAKTAHPVVRWSADTAGMPSSRSSGSVDGSALHVGMVPAAGPPQSAGLGGGTLVHFHASTVPAGWTEARAREQEAAAAAAVAAGAEINW